MKKIIILYCKNCDFYFYIDLQTKFEVGKYRCPDCDGIRVYPEGVEEIDNSL